MIIDGENMFVFQVKTAPKKTEEKDPIGKLVELEKIEPGSQVLVERTGGKWYVGIVDSIKKDDEGKTQVRFIMDNRTIFPVPFLALPDDTVDLHHLNNKLKMSIETNDGKTYSGTFNGFYAEEGLTSKWYFLLTTAFGQQKIYDDDIKKINLKHQF
ncbi:Uncharacterised protein [uncultured archaeon]|nr:Uncharacterised protein [uncultured archaeon]